ncbi:O-antigen ligase family protein [Patescibacteria group bacterium]|nr:O-antigen ligase family protein [Patescibacteria group bacterium]
MKITFLLEKILFWLVIFILFFIPLYPKIPFSPVQGTFVAIRLEDFIVAFVYLLWGIYLLQSKQLKQVWQNSLYRALALFFFIAFVSLFSAIFLTHTVEKTLGFLHYLRRVEYMLMLPVGMVVVKNKKQLSIILVSILVVTILVCLYGLGQQYLHFPVISTDNSEFSKGQILYLTPGARLNSTFAGHYDLAVFMVMFLTVLASVFFALRKYYLKVISALTGGLAAFVLVLTAARQSFVAALVGVVASLLLARKEKLVGLVALLAILALVYPSQLRDRFIATFTVNIADQGQRYTTATQTQLQRSDLNIPTLPSEVSSFSAESSDSATAASKVASDIAPGEPTNSTDLGVYRSLQIRLNVEWPRAIRALEKNPLLGTGYSSLGLATDNDVLRSLGEVGVLGTLAFVFLLIEIIKRVYQNYRSSDKLLKLFSAGILAMIFAYILNSLFIDVFESSKIALLFWLFIGFNIGARKLTS